MYKSIYNVKKMDCPSEKSLVEAKLGSLESIKKLEFDLERREVTVFHSEEDERIGAYLNELNLDSGLKGTSEVNNGDMRVEDSQAQAKLLKTVLYINFGFFLFEIIAGFVSNSMGLVADSLDMLSDATVYAISLFAVGGSLLLKKRVAKLAGYFQILLALLGFVEIIRRSLGFEHMPDFRSMVVVSALALIANMYCLYLFNKSESEDAHMKASWIFTSNDVIINLGVIASGFLVYFLNSNKPDLIIGAIVFIVVINGARKILKLSR